MADLRHPAGSKAAMRQALESVADYIAGQNRLDTEAVSHRTRWWPMMADTVAEVEHALGRRPAAPSAAYLAGLLAQARQLGKEVSEAEQDTQQTPKREPFADKALRILLASQDVDSWSPYYNAWLQGYDTARASAEFLRARGKEGDMPVDK